MTDKILYHCAHADTCGYAKDVLRLVKTDMKDLLTFECKDENCPHCNFEREFAQPEAEESQHEMFTELLKLFTEFGYKKVLQNFIIQRNKQ